MDISEKIAKLVMKQEQTFSLQIKFSNFKLKLGQNPWNYQLSNIVEETRSLKRPGNNYKLKTASSENHGKIFETKSNFLVNKCTTRKKNYFSRVFC